MIYRYSGALVGKWSILDRLKKGVPEGLRGPEWAQAMRNHRFKLHGFRVLKVGFFLPTPSKSGVKKYFCKNALN